VTQVSPAAASGAPSDTYVRDTVDRDDIRIRVGDGGAIGIATAEGDGLGTRRRAGRHPAGMRPAVVAAVDALAAAALMFVGTIDGLGVAEPLAGALGSLAWVGVLLVFGAYGRPAVGDFRPVLGAAGVAGVLLIAVGARPEPGSLVITIATLVTVALVARAVVAALERRARAAGSLRLRTAIVDAVGGASTLDGVLAGETDMTPIVRIDVAAALRRAPRHDAVPAIEADLRAVPEILDDLAIECLLVVGALEHRELEALRRAARRAGAEFRVAIAIPDVRIGDVTAASSGRAAVVSVSRPGTPVAAFVKRLMDVTVASLLLVLTSPLLTLIAVAIKVSSPGPVTFRQWRVTRGGRPFRIFKFRTMDVRHEREPEASTAQPFFKLEDDPRLTSVGRVIRRLSLDELPQLLNVVRGDMSLVGPRPLPIEQVRAHPELLRPRNDVRAGMTGWWQVNGRSDLPPEEAVGHDLFYIENWSLAFDMRILAKTIPAIFTQRGAY
jgi:exopolysaccharide biosynthesis polyprenyl glycosylphosphotransferase